MDTVDATSLGSGPAKQEAGPGVEVLKFAMKKDCFSRDTSFNYHNDEYQLEICFVLTEKVGLVPVDLPYNTRSARCKSNSAHDVI